ncbi:phage tail protein [Citrobacter braakii]|uniref:phage virion morphogenesis protein n=1 Tax=Citrobacter braakii TaxID=57706 RepID=UPI000B9AF554|nr:phage virion morphogenesis protein [Citrobacter braakii]MDL4385831.1 phage virion morphogenesis protein [Citrobacter braakii]OXU09634.1 phage tail protein [Citrobacter braakii]
MSEHALDALEHELAGLLARVSPAERKKLSREIVRDLRKSQIKRIREQKNPDGSAFTRRKAQFITVQREMRFIWRGQQRSLKNWQQNKRIITGFDVNKGAVRSFRKGDIQRFIAVKKDRIKVKGKSKQTRMFKRLATARYMRAFSNENEAAIFFAPAAANIAAIHQYGLKEKLRNLDIQYPSRQLLGFSADDTRRIEAAIIDFLAS